MADIHLKNIYGISMKLPTIDPLARTGALAGIRALAGRGWHRHGGPWAMAWVPWRSWRTRAGGRRRTLGHRRAEEDPFGPGKGLPKVPRQKRSGPRAEVLEPEVLEQIGSPGSTGEGTRGGIHRAPKDLMDPRNTGTGKTGRAG